MVAVPQGTTPAGMNSKPVFPVSPSKRERVSFVLKMRNQAALERKVSNGIYSHYLSVGQFARSYGQTTGHISALLRYLHRFHLTTRTYADRLDVTAIGSAGAFNHALAVSQSVYRTPAIPASAGHAAQPAVTFTANSDAPKLPRTIAAYVQAVVGLVNYPVKASNAIHVPVARPGTAAKSAARTGQGISDPLGELKPQDFASEYGLSNLGSQWQGQGETMGIITFAAMHPADATKFWSAEGIAAKPNRIRIENIDGGAPFGARFDSQESTLDVEQSGGVAPRASIIVYQVPNSDLGGIDAYAAAASENRAQTVSCSWGASETVLAAEERAGFSSPALIKANDEFFLELAAQGQSSFTASGDAGAWAASADLGTANLSVQSTSDSPWTTAAGATTLGPSTIALTDTQNVTIQRERAWGWDWKWPFWSQLGLSSETDAALHNVVGSTGGYSAVETRPAYQSKVPGISTFHAVPYFKPTRYRRVLGTTLREPKAWVVWTNGAKSKPAPKAFPGVNRKGRVVPDLSANGDPYTGYQLYYGGLQDGWGGTSFVAPQLNGAAAVIDSFSGHRTGFWNPEIYRLARSNHSPFTPLDVTGSSNDNLYYTGTAHAIYNPGTGLGTPNLTSVAWALKGAR